MTSHTEQLILEHFRFLHGNEIKLITFKHPRSGPSPNQTPIYHAWVLPKDCTAASIRVGDAPLKNLILAKAKGPSRVSVIDKLLEEVLEMVGAVFVEDETGGFVVAPWDSKINCSPS